MHHQSVLTNQFLEIFSPLQLTCFVDGTLGAGGHAAELLAVHPEIETFIGIDQDPSALKIAGERLAPYGSKCHLIRSNFSKIGTLMKEQGIDKLDGIFIDIGVSSMQIDQAERGFSFMREGPLDMRMDPEGPLTAAEIVNEWDEWDIARIFRDYGEEKQWRRAAKAVVEARAIKPFETTTELADCIKKALKVPFHVKIHPATLVFQGLRIAVNSELEQLKRFLPDALSLLRPGGRLAVISFHSLEDRIVKQAFAYYASDKESTSGIGGMFIDKKPECKILTRKPMEADEAEIAANPRSRSAKLRALEKL
jgi:16S rRNA (cytosine1402-N4)-methyltransferase